jgi:hypothetical protein
MGPLKTAAMAVNYWQRDTVATTSESSIAEGSKWSQTTSMHW